MWQGILQGLTMADEDRARREDREEARRTREEDMAFRREMFNSQILEARRAEALAVARERREQSRAVQEAINGAVGMGFDRRSAEALQSSGQLGFVMRSMEAQEFSPQRISAMSGEILRQLGDRASEDAVAAAILGVVDRNANLNNSRETSIAIAESLLDAEGIESIEQLRLQAESLDSGFGSTEPFSVSLGTTNIDLPELQRVQNQVMQRLQPLFGENTFVVSPSGDFMFAANAPASVVNLVTSLTDKVVESATTTGPGQMTTVSAIQNFTRPIIEASNRGILDVSAINISLPTLFNQGPEAFLESLTPVNPTPAPPTPISNEAAEALTSMTQRRPRQAGGVQPPRVTPTTGFAFDFNEELDR
jgi:hypothetical protein